MLIRALITEKKTVTELKRTQQVSGDSQNTGQIYSQSLSHDTGQIYGQIYGQMFDQTGSSGFGGCLVRKEDQNDAGCGPRQQHIEVRVCVCVCIR